MHIAGLPELPIQFLRTFARSFSLWLLPNRRAFSTFAAATASHVQAAKARKPLLTLEKRTVVMAHIPTLLEHMWRFGPVYS